MDAGAAHIAAGTRSGRRWADPAATLVYAIILVQALFLAGAIASGRFAIAGALVWACLIKPILFIACAWGARRRGFVRIATFIEIVALLILAGALTALNSLVIAGANFPLADPWLASLDRELFGFDSAALGEWLIASPTLLSASHAIYHSASVSMFVLFGWMAWRGHAQAAWRLFSALQLAALIALPIFAFVPAYGTPPYAYAFEHVLDGVRAGSIRLLDLNALTGVITFPSMHAAGGALLAWGMLRLGRLAAPLVLLNVLMIGSAVTSGGHYLVDVIAGLVVAAVALRLSRSVETTWPSRRTVSVPRPPDHSLPEPLAA